MPSIAHHRTLCGQPYTRKVIKTSWSYPLSEQIRQTFEESATQRLADSMGRIGQIAPILVNHVGVGKYVIIAGERRWRAASMIGLTTLEAYVFENLAPIEFFTLQAHENFHEPIPAKDEARAIKRQWDDSHALGFNFSVTAFASAVHMSETKVRDALRYSDNLDYRIQEMVDEGRLPYKVAVRLASFTESDEQLRLAVEIMTHKDGFREAEEIIRKHRETSREDKLFELTVQEWQSNQRELVSGGLRIAAKQGLAYLGRVLYLVGKGHLPTSVLWGTEMPLVEKWIEVGQHIRRLAKRREG